jgi:transcriptional regulator with GAF, ATPase, and Fis domain
LSRVQQPMLGKSQAILDVLAEARYVAPTDSKVLITGESGVGKELLANFVHENSPRSRMPMASINCAGVPESLLESELFGHTRGSFTDAHADRAGLFEKANGGTVLLDEIGETGARMQALLLRVLENGEIQRVGSDRLSQGVDVRIISATNRDLFQQTKDKTFRLDLYYRLNVVNLVIPPLRERREDIRLIFDFFLQSLSQRFRVPVCEVDADAYGKLEAYNWPGNIRELRNVAERVILQRGGRPLTADALPTEILYVGREDGLSAVAAAAPALADAIAEACFVRMVRGRESFWTVVHEPFMLRDLTRDTVRAVVRRGLWETKGSYKSLAPLFNLAPTEYKRMLTFLQQHECHLPFQPFRAMGQEDRVRATERPAEKAAM